MAQTVHECSSSMTIKCKWSFWLFRIIRYVLIGHILQRVNWNIGLEYAETMFINQFNYDVPVQVCCSAHEWGNCYRWLKSSYRIQVRKLTINDKPIVGMACILSTFNVFVLGRDFGSYCHCLFLWFRTGVSPSSSCLCEPNQCMPTRKSYNNIPLNVIKFAIH